MHSVQLQLHLQMLTRYSLGWRVGPSNELVQLVSGIGYYSRSIHFTMVVKSSLILIGS